MLAWPLALTLLQLKIGLRLQTGTYLGLAAIFIDSTVKIAEAMAPTAPPISSSHGKSLGRVQPVFDLLALATSRLL